MATIKAVETTPTSARKESTMKNRIRAGKTLLAFSIVVTVAVVVVADVFNPHHLFNPDWPAHARFHNVMQFTTLCLISVASLIALFGEQEPSRARLAVATLGPATFWPGLFVALLVPGTDVYASESLREIGFPINIAIAAIFIILTGVGYRLAAAGAKR